VWADPQLKALLLGLPLPAMQLLLSSDQLVVASEDTVLFKACQYLGHVGKAGPRSYTAAFESLQTLVRAPQLSLFAIAAAAFSDTSNLVLLSPYQSQLMMLLTLKLIATPEQLLRAVEDEIDRVPASWRLGPRQIRPLADGVRLEWWLELRLEWRLEWRLPVEQLRRACPTNEKVLLPAGRASGFAG
jgi:hypothetical protein